MKNSNQDKLEALKLKAGRYRDKLVKARLKIGQADTPMESQFPSGRFELEQDIQALESILIDIKKEIKIIESSNE